MIQLWFGVWSEFCLAFDLFQKYCANRVTTAEPGAPHDNNVTILPLIIFFTNTRRHNNVSWCISIENMKVIESTGNAEMSFILYSAMRPRANHVSFQLLNGLLFWQVLCASLVLTFIIVQFGYSNSHAQWNYSMSAHLSMCGLSLT